MLQQNVADDYIIATGKTIQLNEFIRLIFEYLDLDWKTHVQVDNTLLRPTDVKANYANPQKAFDKLGWKSKLTINEIVKNMIDSRLARK